MLEGDGEQSKLKRLEGFGFTAEQLVRVLSNSGGSKNLEALVVLLEGDEEQSKLKRLEGFGFTAKQLIKVLSNIGGSKNLEALVVLLEGWRAK